jgi:hypothetical protein
MLAFLVLLVGLTAPLTPSAAAQAGAIAFVHQDGVPLQYQQEIEEGALLARDYLFRTWNLILPEPLLVTSLAGDGVAGYGGPGSLGFSTGSPVWIDTSATQRIKIAVHEYWHAAIGSLDPGMGFLSWMNEGSAEFFGYAAVIERGLIDPAVASAFHQLNVIYAPGMVSLDRLERGFDFSTGPVYSLAYLAIEQLVLRAGPEAVRDYFELTGSGVDARQAFEEAFGQELDAFYAEFAALRDGLTEPATLVQRLLPPGPVLDYPAVVTILAVSTPISGGAQALVTVGTDPSVRCTLEIYAPDGALLETRSTQADRGGIALWFWTVDREQVGRQLSLAASCGGDSAFALLDVV